MRLFPGVLVLMVAGPILAPASPALAQASPCAGLPEKGLVAQSGAVTSAPARPTAARGWRCEPGYRLELQGRMPMCSGAVPGSAPGNPRAACYAALPLGPLAPVAAAARPTQSCAVRKASALLRLDGAGAGWSDAVVSVLPAAGVTIVPLGDAPAENAVVQGCFAWNCRLVRLEIGAAAAARVEMRVAVPGQSVSTPLVLAAGCNDPALR